MWKESKYYLMWKVELCYDAWSVKLLVGINFNTFLVYLWKI